MTREEYEEMVAINAALGGKYDYIIEQIDPSDFDSEGGEGNKSLYVHPIGLGDDRLDGYLVLKEGKITLAFEVKTKLDIDIIANDIKLWLIENDNHILNGSNIYIAVVGPHKTGFVARFVAGGGNVEPTKSNSNFENGLASDWIDLEPIKVNVQCSWAIGKVEIINVSTQYVVYSKIYQNVLKISEIVDIANTYNFDNGNYSVVVYGSDGIGIREEWKNVESIIIKDDLELVIDAKGKVPPSHRLSFLPEWAVGQIELIDDTNQIITKQEITNYKGEITEQFYSTTTGSITVKITGHTGFKLKKDWFIEKKVIIKNTKLQPIKIKIQQPEMLPINLSFTNQWVAGRIEMRTSNSIVVGVEEFVTEMKGSIVKELSIPDVGEFICRIVAHNGLSYTEELYEERKVYIQNGVLQPIKIHIHQPVLPSIKIVKQDLPWVVGKVDIVTPDAALLLERYLTQDKGGTFKTGGGHPASLLLNDFLPVIDYTAGLMSGKGFKVRFHAYDNKLGFSIPNVYEETDVYHLYHHSQAVQIDWTSKEDAKDNFIKKITLTIDFQADRLDCRNSSGELIERIDKVILKSNGTNTFHKVISSDDEYIIVADGRKLDDQRDKTIETNKVEKVQLEKGDILEVTLKVEQGVYLYGLEGGASTREANFSAVIKQYYTQELGILISALRDNKNSLMYANIVYEEEKFDYMLVYSFVKECLSLREETEKIAQIMGLVESAGKLFYEVVRTYKAEFDQVRTVQEYYNLHIQMLVDYQARIMNNELYRRVMLNARASSSDSRQEVFDPLVSILDDEFEQYVKKSIENHPLFGNVKAYRTKIFDGWLKRYGLQGTNENQPFKLSFAISIFQNKKKGWLLERSSKNQEIIVVPNNKEIGTTLSGIGVKSLLNPIFSVLEIDIQMAIPSGNNHLNMGEPILFNFKFERLKGKWSGNLPKDNRLPSMDALVKIIEEQLDTIFVVQDIKFGK